LTSAIIGAGNIGSALARHLVAGGEPVVLAANDESHAQALAERLAPLARANSVDYAIATADVVVFAVWLDTIKEMIAEYASQLENKVVVDPRIRSGSTRTGKSFGRCPMTSRPGRSSPRCCPPARTT
jgi:predicted dinucleotide-binding enzyme